MRNFGNFAVDNCTAALRNTMDAFDYSEIVIEYVPKVGRVFIDWRGYSFTCSYGRNVASVDTIGP